MAYFAYESTLFILGSTVFGAVMRSYVVLEILSYGNFSEGLQTEHKRTLISREEGGRNRSKYISPRGSFKEHKLVPLPSITPCMAFHHYP